MTATTHDAPTNAMSRGMSFADYLANEGFGSSDLHTMRAGVPAVVRHRRENRTSGSRFAGIGKAVHCRILTPDLFAQDFYCKGRHEEFRTKDARAARDALLDAGKTILSYEDAEITRAAEAAVLTNPDAATALKAACGREVSVFWECERSGLRRKCRPDFWFPFRDAKMVVDIKVTVEATKPLDRILRAAAWNGWIHQLAGNRDGLLACGEDVQYGGLLIVPNSPPFAERVRLLVWGPGDLEIVESDNRATCTAIKQCVDSGVWPNASEGGWQLHELPPNMFQDTMAVEQLEGAEVVNDG